MIRRIRGKVLSVETLGAVIEVAGFGVFVHLAEPSKLAGGAEASVLTHLALKQDGIELYGFLTEADLGFFERLLRVPSVGPKTALSFLRRAPREAVEAAIGRRDLAYLTRVVGLGKKTAEKILVELGDKMGGAGAGGGDDAEVFDTLVALGYTEREARRALSGIGDNISGKEARLRAALSGGGR